MIFHRFHMFDTADGHAIRGYDGVISLSPFHAESSSFLAIPKIPSISLLDFHDRAKIGVYLRRNDTVP
jgi:hypothetical protein